MIRRHTHFTTTITTPLGDDVELELPVNLNDWENPEIITRFTPNHIVVGYLAHDDSPSNPLDDCDGMGKIHHHPRSRYGRRDSDYYEVLGLDSNGDPVIDEDKMQMLWRDKVLAIPPERFVPPEGFEDELFEPCPIYSSRGEPKPYWEHFRQLLANEEAGDYDFSAMAKYAWRRLDVSEELIQTLIDQVEDYISWDWDEVRRECWVGADPDAVLLDLYDHSGVTWSVSGGGMQCQWDTSRGESVWVPDQYAREEVDTRAPIYDHAVVHETNWLKGRGRKYRLKVDGKTIKESDDWLPLYHIAKEIARLRTKAGMPAWNNGRWTAARQLAANAAESYTDYCNGNAYGVIVAVYNMDGDLVEDDACWGFLGDNYAEECLMSEVEDMVERYAQRDAALVESEGVNYENQNG